jgi:hypothetical protein
MKSGLIRPDVQANGAWSALNGTGRHGEKRAAPLNGVNFGAVTEQIGRMLHDEEPEAKTVSLACGGSFKGLEDRRQRVGAYASAGVAHLDA